MGKHSFTPAERWAVFTTHGDRCYLGGEPIDFTSMEVDHIIPERLLDDPKEIAQARRSFNLDSTFDINSFENWLPACGPCNRKKSDIVFEAMPIIAVQLKRARTKAPEARRLAAQTVSDKKLADALATIERAMTLEDLPPEKLKPLVQFYLQAHPKVVHVMLREMEQRNKRLSRFSPVSRIHRPPLLELRLTPFATVRYQTGDFEIVAKL